MTGSWRGPILARPAPARRVDDPPDRGVRRRKDGLMFANVVTFQRQPGRVDEGVRRFREEVAPIMKQQAGFKGAYVLVDRASGKSLSVTLWETAEAAQAASAALVATRDRVSQEHGDTAPPSRELFEVAAQL